MGSNPPSATKKCVSIRSQLRIRNMKLSEIQDREIVLVSGNLCSGKGTYCKTHYPNFYHITISDIVRSLISGTTRSAFATTKHLDKNIIELLIREIYQHNKVVVDGIRQISIIKALQQTFGDQIKDIIWLDVPDDIARDRFMKRASTKDDQTYDESRAGDKNLGIEDVENYIRANHRVVQN